MSCIINSLSLSLRNQSIKPPTPPFTSIHPSHRRIMNIFLAIFLFLIPIFLLLTRGRRSSKRVPPGVTWNTPFRPKPWLSSSHACQHCRKMARRKNQKVWSNIKASLFGKPTVFVYGQAANKFVFSSDSSTIGYQQNQSLRKILGDRNIFELGVEDHKRVRGALVSFLKPESLKQYVGKMDGEVKEHLEMHWHGKQQVEVVPLMKTLTFNTICSLIFGVERGARRDKFLACFREMMVGMRSVPVNLPFTRYNCGIKASATVQNMVKDLIREKTVELEQKGASPHQDLITCLLSTRKDNEEVLTEDEIVHNVMVVMVAGHDTSSVLMTFIIRLLANEPTVYAAALQEQEEIAKTKPSGEFLTWEDLTKMKYTWRVAMETLRMVPPAFGGFRKALKDIEYGGYLIPKGWQIFWAIPMTHMDSSIFPEPSKFDPSRFENQTSVPPYSFVAFGAGPRICPGYEFARIETLITIHYLVTQFTWKLCADNSFSRDPMPIPTQGLPIKLVPRKLC